MIGEVRSGLLYPGGLQRTLPVGWQAVFNARAMTAQKALCGDTVDMLEASAIPILGVAV